MPPALHHPADVHPVKLFEVTSKSVVLISWTTNRSPTGKFGAGVILEEKGILVTNCHVIEGADDSEIRVTFIDGKVCEEVRVLRKCSVLDLAVLEVNAPRENLRPILVSDSDHLAVGQGIYVIGHPHGLWHSFTAGRISGVNRFLGPDGIIHSGASTDPGSNGGPLLNSWEELVRIIQIDASIDHGSSGGPLLNSWGELIGIIRSRLCAGFGFAIPLKTIKKFVLGMVSFPNDIGLDLSIGLQNQSDKILNSVNGLCETTGKVHKAMRFRKDTRLGPGIESLPAKLEHRGHFHHNHNDVVGYVLQEVSEDEGLIIFWEMKKHGKAEMPNGKVLKCCGICKECKKIKVDPLPCDDVEKFTLDHTPRTVVASEEGRRNQSDTFNEAYDEMRKWYHINMPSCQSGPISGKKSAPNNSVDQLDKVDDTIDQGDRDREANRPTSGTMSAPNSLTNGPSERAVSVEELLRSCICCCLRPPIRMAVSSTDGGANKSPIQVSERHDMTVRSTNDTRPGSEIESSPNHKLEHPGHFHLDLNDVARYLLEENDNRFVGYMDLESLRLNGVVKMPNGNVIVCLGICKKCNELEFDILPSDHKVKSGHTHRIVVDPVKWNNMMIFNVHFQTRKKG